MHTLSEIVRLSAQGLSPRKIARSVGLGRTTVIRYIERAETAGISWPLPDGMTEAALEDALTLKSDRCISEEPDWAEIHRDLCGSKFSTLQLLWVDQWAAVMSYQTFCRRYDKWKSQLKLSMRKHYKGGEVLFVDFAGDTMKVTDRSTGEKRDAHVFVAVLGASNFTFAEAVWRENLESWVSLLVKSLEFIGGVPEIVVSDNAKAVVTKAGKYDPQLHHMFVELSRHYEFALLPARPRKPQDKAKVEAGVRHVQQGILGKLEKRTFLSLDELNSAIRKELHAWNDKPFQKLSGCRRELFNEIEVPALKRLPQERFEFAEWRKSKVHIDYHIQVEKHFYSVSHALVKKEVDVRIARNTIEVFFRGERVASHARSGQPGRFSTNKEHMPMHHREFAEQSAEYFLKEAEKVGPWTHRFVQGVFESRKYPQLGYRTCQGVFRLFRKYGSERLEAASKRAVQVHGFAFRTLQSMLLHNLDQVERAPVVERKVVHLNIRGADYYNEEERDVDTSNVREAAKPEAKWNAGGSGAPNGEPGNQRTGL